MPPAEITDLITIELVKPTRNPFTKEPSGTINFGKFVDNESHARDIAIGMQDDTITDISVRTFLRTDMFAGIKTCLKPEAFSKQLEEHGIAYSAPESGGFELYENWVALFFEHGRLAEINWRNPAVFSDIDLLALAFPPRR